MFALVSHVEPTPLPDPAPPRRGGFGLGILLGVVVGIIGLVVWNLLPSDDSLPRLSEETFTAAQQTWKEQRLANYDLAVTVTGDAHGTYRLSVRGDQLSGTLDGRPIPPSRGESLRFWTVPGMFDVIQIDVDKCFRPAPSEGNLGDKAQNSATTGRLVLSAEFDPTYGYPRRYRRIELGTRRAVAWEVTEFTAR